MNLRRLTARASVAGVSAALAVGALVGISTTSANAADTPPTGSYTCTIPGVPGVSLPVALSVGADLSGFPTLPSGFPVQHDSFGVNLTFTVPAEVVTALKGAPYNLTELGVGSTGMSFPFGSGAVPLKAFTIAPAALPDSGALSLAANDVKNNDFALPNPGALTVKMPKTFNLSTTMTLAPTINCTTATQPTVATYTVIKQSAGVATAKGLPKSVKKGKAFNIPATVTGAFKTATGTVTAKAGKTVLGTGTLKNGKVTIKVKKGLKKTSNVTLTYNGDTSTNKVTSFPFTIKVK